MESNIEIFFFIFKLGIFKNEARLCYTWTIGFPSGLRKKKKFVWKLHEKTLLISLLYIFIQRYKSINPLWLCFYEICKCQSIVSIEKNIVIFFYCYAVYICFDYRNVIVIFLVLHFNFVDNYNCIEMSSFNRKEYAILSRVNEG